MNGRLECVLQVTKMATDTQFNHLDEIQMKNEIRSDLGKVVSDIGTVLCTGLGRMIYVVVIMQRFCW